jgi:DNA-binding CsgD family transcriptional regulator
VGDRQLIGREHELEFLLGRLELAAGSRGGLVLLAGDAGVGKTRLAEAAIARRDVSVIRTTTPSPGATPYGPIAAALREGFRRDPRAMERLGRFRPFLAALLPELGRADEPDEATLIEAIRVAIEAIAHETTTVIFVDDLQAADTATLELLPVLAGWTVGWPLLVLAAYRSDEVTRHHPIRGLRTALRRTRRFDELIVAPLDRTATTTLAADVLGEPIGPRLGTILFDRTEGVPLFIEELVATLPERSSLVATPEGRELDVGASVPLPTTILDAVRVRIDRLSPEARATLECAAVAGSPFAFEVLVELGEEAGLAEALDTGVVVELADGGRGRFRHELTREAVYADAAWPRRRDLHRRLASHLDPSAASPISLAWHWQAGGDPAKARPLLIQAAAQSARVHAYRDAASIYRSALEGWPETTDPDERCRVLGELGRSAIRAGDTAEAIRAWEEQIAGLRLPDQAHDVAQARRDIAAAYDLRGAYQLAYAAHRKAADAFAASDEPREAAAETYYAGHNSEDPDEALRLFEAAAIGAGSAGDADLEARAQAYAGWAAAKLGRHEAGRAAADAALATALAGDHLHAASICYWVIGAIENFYSEYGEAVRAFEAAAAVCRRMGDGDAESACLGCLALVLYGQGDWPRAGKAARDALAMLPASQHPLSLCALGLLELVSGSIKQGRSHLRKASTLARRTGATRTISMTAYGLALASELDGVPGPWSEVLTVNASSPEPVFAPGVRWAATFAGVRDDRLLVHACIELMTEPATRLGSADVLAALAHAIGEAAALDGDNRAAVESFKRALDLQRTVEAPFERAITQWRAGVAFSRVDRAEAVALLTGAYRTFRDLRARPFAMLVAADLQRIGEPIDRRLGRRAAGDLARGGLTRREIEVTRLVGAGRSNDEIAHELFLSPRTVEMHVRNVLSKLDCQSRAEAATRARTMGLLAD